MMKTAIDDETPATFAQMAALEFEPERLDLEALPSAAHLNNPYMVSVRLAAVTLTKSKADLIEIVRGLGGDTPEGGELWPMVQQLQGAQALFKGFVDMLSAAETRLLCAASVIAVELGLE